MTSFFDTIRRGTRLKLTVAFSFAAALGVNAMNPPADPQTQELRQLAQEYAKRGPFMPRAHFDRFSDLLQKYGNDPAVQQSLSGAGFCAHGSGGGTGGGSGSSISATCPCDRRRRANGDLSHLLVFNHWL